MWCHHFSPTALDIFKAQRLLFWLYIRSYILSQANGQRTSRTYQEVLGTAVRGPYSAPQPSNYVKIRAFGSLSCIVPCYANKPHGVVENSLVWRKLLMSVFVSRMLQLLSAVCFYTRTISVSEQAFGC